MKLPAVLAAVAVAAITALAVGCGSSPAASPGPGARRVRRSRCCGWAKTRRSTRSSTRARTRETTSSNGPKSALGALYETFNVTNPDPNSFASALLGSINIPSGGTKAANYDPPAIDHLISESTATQDPAQRLDIYGQMLKILAQTCPMCRSTSKTTMPRCPANSRGPGTTSTPSGVRGN